MKTFVLIASTLLVGCANRTPVVSDTEFNEFEASNPGMTEACLNEVRYNGFNAWQPDDPDCYELLPAQRWSGLWEHGWEWTNFCPDPAKQCEWMSKRGKWLTFAENAYHGPDLPDGVHQIEFVGRRTKVPGNFGHQGSYDHLMVVDRVISIQTIPGEKYTKRF